MSNPVYEGSASHIRQVLAKPLRSKRLKCD